MKHLAAIYSRVVFIRYYPPPQTLCPPNSRAQTFQLNDLAVIDKEVHVRAVVFDIPREYIRIGCFEHELLRAKLVDEFCGNIRAPWIYVLGDPFAFDHDDLRAGLEKSFCLRNRPARIPRTFGLQLRSRRGAARAELNTNFGLRFHSRFAHQIN